MIGCIIINCLYGRSFLNSLIEIFFHFKNILGFCLVLLRLFCDVKFGLVGCNVIVINLFVGIIWLNLYVFIHSIPKSQVESGLYLRGLRWLLGLLPYLILVLRLKLLFVGLGWLLSFIFGHNLALSFSDNLFLNWWCIGVILFLYLVSHVKPSWNENRFLNFGL